MSIYRNVVAWLFGFQWFRVALLRACRGPRWLARFVLVHTPLGVALLQMHRDAGEWERAASLVSLLDQAGAL